jgi:ankyrin repeat protein
MLLDAGIDVNQTGENGWTPLHEAISYGHDHVCRYLISRGANVNLLNENCETPRALGERIGMSPERLDQLFGKSSGQLAMLAENRANTTVIRHEYWVDCRDDRVYCTLTQTLPAVTEALV